MLQGSNRFQRGLNWFSYMKKHFEDAKQEFNWKMDHFDGGHDGGKYLQSDFLLEEVFGA